MKNNIDFILLFLFYGSFILFTFGEKRTPSSYEDYYNEKYFKWQLKHHKFAADSIRKSDYQASIRGLITPNATVLDFGCSGGMILDALKGKRKICVEINNHARNYACSRHKNLECYQYPEDVPKGVVDVVHTSAVLEHCEAPIKELRHLWGAMKPGAVIYIMVVNDGRSNFQNWGDADLNKHIYTWNSLLLGNMIEGACFTDIKITSDRNAYPPNHWKVRASVNDSEWARIIQEEGKRIGHENLYAVAHKPIDPKATCQI